MRQVKGDILQPKREAKLLGSPFYSDINCSPYQIRWTVAAAVRDRVRVILDFSIGTMARIDDE